MRHCCRCVSCCFQIFADIRCELYCPYLKVYIYHTSCMYIYIYICVCVGVEYMYIQSHIQICNDASQGKRVPA